MADSVPPELLEKIFKYLDPASRKVVRLVNRKWAKILWTDLCLRKQVLLVNPATLTDDWVLQQMKRPFAEIHITTEVIPSDNWKTIYYDRVKDLITSAVITENVRIIKLDANVKVLNYLFRHQTNCSISYQKLEEFTFLTSVDSLCIGRVNINAAFPNLKVLKLDSLSSGSIRLVRIFARQITKLVVRIAYRRRLLAILSLRNLDKLTELSIGTIAHSRSEGEFLAYDDFDPQHLDLLRRLQRFEINDSANLFVFVYHFILGEMQSLTHLKITGVEMLPNVLHSINQLPNLKFLQLLARSGNLDYMPMVRFNLPHLETLHMAPQLMACAGDLPKLHTLGVINHTDKSVSWNHFAGPGALQTYTLLKTVRKLHVRGIYFSSHNLHPILHFPRSCKVLLEDKEDFTIGTVNVTRSASIASLRCEYRGEIDDLTIRRPAAQDCEVDHDVSQFVTVHSRSCMVWLEHRLMRRLERLGDRIVHDYKACKRAIQRHNLYNLKRNGCVCDCYYYGPA